MDSVILKKKITESRLIMIDLFQKGMDCCKNSFDENKLFSSELPDQQPSCDFKNQQSGIPQKKIRWNMQGAIDGIAEPDELLYFGIAMELYHGSTGF